MGKKDVHAMPRVRFRLLDPDLELHHLRPLLGRHVLSVDRLRLRVSFHQ